MSGEVELRALAADLLHDAIDGDNLVGAARSIGNDGEDVALRDARTSEVVWWAVSAMEPLLARLVAAEGAVERVREVMEHERTMERNSLERASDVTEARWDFWMARVGRHRVARRRLEDALDGPQGDAITEVAPESTGKPGGPQGDPECGCYACYGSQPAPGTLSGWLTIGMTRMIVCGQCGNKRCPHGTDHRNDCTGSNEPGQIGSRYAAPSEDRP